MRLGCSAVGVGLLFAVLTGSIACGETAACGDAARGKAYYTTCAGCHGNRAEGQAGMNAPALAGLPADYLIRQLRSFRDGVRGGPADFYGFAMNGRAKAVPGDQAVLDVVAFIATLPRIGIAPQASAAAGRPLYASCVACHGASGEGNGALGAPPLHGRESWYLAAQLRNFKAGTRGSDATDRFGQNMRAAAAALPDDAAIEAVSLYLARLR